MKDFFFLEESPYCKNKNTIRLNEEKIVLKSVGGSRNVLMARLLDLSWVDFLRLCRDAYGAEIYGKNSLYPIPYFPMTEDGGARLCKELNDRMKQVVKKRFDFLKK